MGSAVFRIALADGVQEKVPDQEVGLASNGRSRPHYFECRRRPRRCGDYGSFRFPAGRRELLFGTGRRDLTPTLVG